VKKSLVNGIIYYKVNFLTMPNKASYEVMMSYVKKDASSSKNGQKLDTNFNSNNADRSDEGQFVIGSPESISRTNPYGNQPICLQQVPVSRNLAVDLRKFCFCKVFLRQKSREANRYKKVFFF
jgi:hypothetical protein